ncbi:GntR family transcriptional regulator [Microbispora corallina]|uniref:GntR family transcriptional regulator n=1 Tax=Microbispora corallina TaxID=83302 RepID=A0ABQ4G1E9_9ACTN|nr:GntR family transcriptional regulator [Microbispora corallina]GIH40903.1 GntR family transcriptional regulator [Microbispora corallina]
MTDVGRPKHQRVLITLEREIRSGRVPHGSRLPGETTLARRFGVSRTTVRSALAELNEAGLITTRTGKGSFVLFDGRPLDTRLGWARALAAQGVETRVRVLTVAMRRDDALAERLNLSSPEVVVVERLREVAGGGVVSYERSCLPAVDGLRDLPERGLDGGSLTEELSRAGLRPDHGEQRMGGRRLDGREAGLLGREAGAWFLTTRRTSWSAGGAFAEDVESLLDPDHFELFLTFSESGLS